MVIAHQKGKKNDITDGVADGLDPPFTALHLASLNPHLHHHFISKQAPYFSTTWANYTS